MLMSLPSSTVAECAYLSLAFGQLTAANMQGQDKANSTDVRLFSH